MEGFVDTVMRFNLRLLTTYVTVFWKTDHLHTKTEIHLLPVRDRHTHALSRNTKYQTIDCQVCFYRRLFADAVKPQGCISWSWGALKDCMGFQTAPHGSLGLPGGLYPFMPLTEGTALPFEFEWVLYPAFGSPPPSHPPTPYRINP